MDRKKILKITRSIVDLTNFSYYADKRPVKCKSAIDGKIMVFRGEIEWNKNITQQSSALDKEFSNQGIPATTELVIKEGKVSLWIKRKHVKKEKES